MALETLWILALKIGLRFSLNLCIEFMLEFMF